MYAAQFGLCSKISCNRRAKRDHVALIDLFNPLLNAIKRALGPFGKLWDIITRFWTAVTTVIPKAQALASLIIGEVTAWKQFKEAIPFRTGVINVKSAVEGTKDLAQELIDAWHAVVELVQTVKSKVTDLTGGDPSAAARSAVEEIENSSFRDIISKFPRLVRGLEKILAWVGLVAEVLEDFITFVDDLTTIVNALVDLRNEIETGSTVFLQQKNARRTVQLKKGGSIKIRVGNLHS